jgi:hypothetical protein
MSVNLLHRSSDDPKPSIDVYLKQLKGLGGK